MFIDDTRLKAKVLRDLNLPQSASLLVKLGQAPHSPDDITSPPLLDPLGIVVIVWDDAKFAKPDPDDIANRLAHRMVFYQLGTLLERRRLKQVTYDLHEMPELASTHIAKRLLDEGKYFGCAAYIRMTYEAAIQCRNINLLSRALEATFAMVTWESWLKEYAAQCQLFEDAGLTYCNQLLRRISEMLSEFRSELCREELPKLVGIAVPLRLRDFDLGASEPIPTIRQVVSAIKNAELGYGGQISPQLKFIREIMQAAAGIEKELLSCFHRRRVDVISDGTLGALLHELTTASKSPLAEPGKGRRR